MNGRQGEKQEPWLLIKENDDEARPATDTTSSRKAGEREKKRGRVVEAGSTRAGRRRAKARGAKRNPRAAAAAKPAKLPLVLHAAARDARGRPPEGEGWIYEVKFDGYRIVARVDGDDVTPLHAQRQRLDARLRPLARRSLARHRIGVARRRDRRARRQGGRASSCCSARSTTSSTATSSSSPSTCRISTGTT
jgi:bifunctional non-homologous end joining protein LigD